MDESSPYGPPQAPVGSGEQTLGQIEVVASGQKLVIYAILFQLVTVAVQMTVGSLPVVLALTVLVSIIGVVRLSAGMGHSIVTRIILAILMLVPPINLITLLVLNSRATRTLRAAGYKVGLLGASKPA